jgi:hypothetical protein
MYEKKSKLRQSLLLRIVTFAENILKAKVLEAIHCFPQAQCYNWWVKF